VLNFCSINAGRMRPYPSVPGQPATDSTSARHRGWTANHRWDFIAKPSRFRRFALFFVPPLVGAWTPALPEYLFFATIETVCTSVIIWQAWTWSEVKPAVSSARVVGQPEAGITSS